MNTSDEHGLIQPEEDGKITLRRSLYRVPLKCLGIFQEQLLQIKRKVHINMSVNKWLLSLINHLTPNGHFSGRTAPQTYRCCIFLFIQQIYILNILNMLHNL
jgi:hypothetical protein